MEMYADLVKMESTFDVKPWIEWHNSHIELPIFAISLYLVFIFYVPDIIKDNKIKMHLKLTMAGWNLALAVFSMLGASRVVPKLFSYLSAPDGGFIDSLCNHTDYLDGGSGLWMMLFIYSKFFELFDTVFLVLHARPVIFLHWFHHVTVLLYCWLSFGQMTSTGLWFCAMNYCVHSIMYLYYCLMIFRSVRPFIRPIAPLITTIQISQMVGGMVVCWTAARQKLAFGDKGCMVEDNNWKLGLAMYFSYFLLFAALFYEKFLKPKPAAGSKNAGKTPAVCNATDASGMFRSSSSGNIEDSNKKTD
eukprot:g5089.t1